MFVGESIGASIGLILAARGNPRIVHVVAVNPYDYGRWGGTRRHALPPKDIGDRAAEAFKTFYSEAG